MKLDRITIKQTSSGNLTITIEAPGAKPITMGAAKTSPVGQTVNLLERLLELIDYHGVKEYGQ